MPDDVDDKTRELVSKVILTNHLNGRDVDTNSIPHYGSCPYLINTNVSKENVEKVTKCMSGSTCPIELDSVSFRYWLLKFGRASTLLRKTYPIWWNS